MDQPPILRGMFGSLFRRTAPPEDDTPNPQVAMAMLLVRVARSDEDYTVDEQAAVDYGLAKRFDLTPAQAAALRTEAEATEATAPDDVRFTRVLKDSVAVEDRPAIFADLWRVALADGDRDAHENAYLRVLAPLLGVTDRDSALARQSVQTQ